MRYVYLQFFPSLTPLCPLHSMFYEFCLFREDEKWQCLLCQSDDKLKLDGPDRRENATVTASGAQKRRTASGLTEKELKVSDTIVLDAELPLRCP